MKITKLNEADEKDLEANKKLEAELDADEGLSVAELRKKFNDSDGIDTKATIAEDILIKTLGYKNALELGKIRSFRKSVGDSSFARWMESFTVEEATNKNNDFITFLDYSIKESNLLRDILKIPNAIFKLYNAYVHDGMINIKSMLNKISGDNNSKNIINRYLTDEKFYDCSQNEMIWILKNVLFNPDNIGVLEGDKVLTYREIRDSLIDKGKISDDSDVNNVITIKNNDTSKLSDNQIQALLKSIASTEKGKNAINNFK